MPAEDVWAALSVNGFSVYLEGFSAIDSWLGRSKGAVLRILTSAGITDLARLFENLRYPGVAIADAALDCSDCSLYFTCEDSENRSLEVFDQLVSRPSFKLLAFYEDLSRGRFRRFIDPKGNYPLLLRVRKGEADAGMLQDRNPGAEHCRALMDAALIVAKYVPGGEDAVDRRRFDHSADIKTAARLQNLAGVSAPSMEEQRLLLAGLLTAPNPAAGLELLRRGGFIAEFWPELAAMNDVDHTKEFHPEGNVWKHTLETFRYRKNAPGCKGAYDLQLSLGLLLHDVGKPAAETSGSRRFDGHAELGERQARRFLERLGFEAPLVNDTAYLVRNHMLPAALPRLPIARTGQIMTSPLFPALLELYRCDESSSFKGLDGYYESSAAYQSFLRNRRNPYRSADGKKLTRGQLRTNDK